MFCTHMIRPVDTNGQVSEGVEGSTHLIFNLGTLFTERKGGGGVRRGKDKAVQSEFQSQIFTDLLLWSWNNLYSSVIGQKQIYGRKCRTKQPEKQRGAQGKHTKVVPRNRINPDLKISLLA